jgi:hypothetical protein
MMSDRYSQIESRLTAIENRLAKLERSVQSSPSSEELEFGPVVGDGFVGNTASNLGRTLLIFGGAYLLRAITDAQVVATGFGLLLGAAYALLWLYMSYRASAVDTGRTAAAYYGVTSVLLALPLAIEAATRFGLLSGPQSAIALTLFCALALSLALIRQLRSVAWVVTAGGVATGMVLIISARQSVTAAGFLLLLGLGALWGSYYRSWSMPRWLGALGANAGVVVLVLLGVSEQWAAEPTDGLLLAALLLASYLTSFAIRTHALGRAVGPFESLQSIAAIAILLAAAFAASRHQQVGSEVAGMLLLVLGVAGYALAFWPGGREGRPRSLFFYASIGLIMLLAGSSLVFAPDHSALLWAILAVVMAWTSGRTGHVTLSLQSTILLVAAGIGSGILAAGIHALAGQASNAWPSVNALEVIVAAATVVCLFIPVAQSSERWGRLAGLPQLVVLALSVWGVGGLMVAIAAPWIAQVPGPESRLGVLSALRTGVLSAASVTLALSSLHKRWPEARWLAYPVLVLIGFKLLLEDIPNGQPSTLFVSFALVGGAMILVSKLMGLRKQQLTVDHDQSAVDSAPSQSDSGAV